MTVKNKHSVNIDGIDGNCWNLLMNLIVSFDLRFSYYLIISYLFLSHLTWGPGDLDPKRPHPQNPRSQGLRPGTSIAGPKPSNAGSKDS